MPETGTFLSPDPFVQFPESTQNYNRYTYVANNPLSYTDPSGHFIAAFVGLAMAVEGATIAHTMFTVFVVGFLETGSATQGALSALSAGAGMGIAGSALGQASGFWAGLGEAVAHGVAQGAISAAGGGRFGDGALGAFVGSAVSSSLGGRGAPATKAEAIRKVIAAAIAGGTAARVGGGKFANGALTGAFAAAVSTSRIMSPTGSAAEGNVAIVELPDSVQVEASGFASAEDAARAAGARYGGEGVKRSQELQIGLTKLGEGNWGYLTPGWGPSGATIVDPNPLLDMYRANGLRINALMHGHFDAQLNFSSTDFALVWGTKRNIYLVNRRLEVRRLNNGHLTRALDSLPRSYRLDGLDGLQRYYERSGLPGDSL